MEPMQQAFIALELGGVTMYPLFFLAVLATAIILEKGFLYWRYARLPSTLRELVVGGDFAWPELERQLLALSRRNYLGRFLRAILSHRLRPAAWLESRATDEAKAIEEILNRGLWVLETIVTAAPLLGLLGTITGMMQAFKLFGAHGLVDPAGVTGGVAQALIATAFGLLIALVALFGFNFYSRREAYILDQLERLGTCLIERVVADQQGQESSREIA